MKQKTRYMDEPMELGRVVRDLIPPPDRLIFREDAVKVTLSLSTRAVYFFKQQAERHGVQYQRMIRKVLDAYVDAFQGPEGPSRQPAHRVEQPAHPYRKRRAV